MIPLGSPTDLRRGSELADLTTDFPEMNPDDPSLDVWHQKREGLQGDRPPGLINLNRYPIAAGSAGIATFLQRPVALTPADLRAAEVDVAILGVLDPAYAPGTRTPEPNGLTPRELFPMLRRLGAETNLVGLESVEVNPLVDPTYVTPLVANRWIREFLTGIGMRKNGTADKHLLHPHATDHGQD